MLNERLQIGYLDLQTRPTIDGVELPKNIFPKDTIPYARMPFGIKGDSIPQSTSLISGRASIIPFLIEEEVTGYRAISNKIGSPVNGPWTVRVALYNIDSGISSPLFIESSDVQVSSQSPITRIASFVEDGDTLKPGWYAHVSWLVSGNGVINNSSSFMWSNYAVIGGKFEAGTNELPRGPGFEIFYLITGLTGLFYETGSPSGIGTMMTTSATATNVPWFFPYY
jgi:hypothetical protein